MGPGHTGTAGRLRPNRRVGCDVEDMWREPKSVASGLGDSTKERAGQENPALLRD